MKISIIVPMFNAADTIEKLLQSIDNQTYSNFEVLLINDGSTDKTELLCKQYSNKDQRFLYFYKKNGGVSSARNYGLERISGELISFLDSDDYIDSNYLQVLYESIEDSEEIDLVVCGYYRPTSTHPIESKITDSIFVIEDLISKDGPRGYLWNKLFYANIIKKSNLFLDDTIHFGEDLLFCVEYLINTRKVRYISDVLYHYNDSNSGITSYKYSSKKVTFLTSLDSIIKKLEYTEFNDRVLKKYKTYYTIVALSLYRHGRDQMKENEGKRIFSSINKYSLSDIEGFFNKVKLLSVQLLIQLF